MDQNSDIEMEDIRKEMAKDLDHTRKEEKDVRSPSPLSALTPLGQFLVLGVVGIFILLVVFALFLRGDNKVSIEDLNVIKDRFDHLEKRLTRLEGTEQKIASIETKDRELKRSMSKLNKSGSSLTQRLDKLNLKIDRLETRMASVGTKSKTQRAVQKKSVSQTKRHYHEVRRGDTLYRISKKYGIPMDKILRLNNLTKNHDIYPGQKILVLSNDR